MSFSTKNQKMTMFTITSENGARRVIGRGGGNIKDMRQKFGGGLYIRVEDTKTRRVAADQLSDDGYVKMKCENSNGVTRMVSIFVGTSPPRDDDGNVLVMVKPVMVSAWTKAVVDRAIGQIDAITNRRESDLTTKVSSCPGNLIKHVIGGGGSGLRRIEREVGDGCYISCSDGAFVVKANSKKSALRGKIIVEKKITELVQRFRFQKKAVVVEAPITFGANSFCILGAESDDEDLPAPPTQVSPAHPVVEHKDMSRSTKRRLRRKATAAKLDDDKAVQGVLDDPAVMFSRSQTMAQASSTGIIWTSDSSTVEDTVETTSSDSSDDVSPLSGAWGAQTVTLGEALEDAVSRGDTFAPFVSTLPKKSARVPQEVESQQCDFDIMTADDRAMSKKFSDMVDNFAVGTWGSDSDSDDVEA